MSHLQCSAFEAERDEALDMLLTKEKELEQLRSVGGGAGGRGELEEMLQEAEERNVVLQAEVDASNQPSHSEPLF
jgi:hypothetical protein